MKWLTERLRTRTALLVGAVGSLLNIVAFWIEPYPHAVGSDATIWDLQLAGTAERFAGVLTEWVEANGIEAIDNAAKTILRLDYTFPVLYSLFFAAALARLWSREPDRSARLVLVPFVAGLCDMTENTLHLALLAEIPPLDAASINGGMVGWATGFAVTKYGLLGVSLVLIGAGIVRSRRRGSEG